MVRYCRVLGCQSRGEKNSNISFHRFPRKDTELREKWLKATGRTALTTKDDRVCSLHFLQTDYYYNIVGNKLKRNVVPTLLVYNTENLQSSSSNNHQVDEISQQSLVEDSKDVSTHTPKEFLEIEEEKLIEMFHELSDEKEVKSEKENFNCKLEDVKQEVNLPTMLEYSPQDSLYEPNTDRIVLIHNCKKCAYFTKSSFYMKNHINNHRIARTSTLFDCCLSQPESFLCKECNFNTHSTIDFKNHIKLHGKRFVCKKCKFETTVTSLGEKHECFRKLYQCNRCPSVSKSRSCLRAHVLFKHTDSENVRWHQCSVCPYRAKRAGLLKRHVIYKHAFSSLPTGSLNNTDFKWFFCHLCPYKGKVKYDLKRHIAQKHTVKETEDIKLIGCDKCPFMTKYHSSLRIHNILQHTESQNITWFQCELCPYKARYKGALKQHRSNMHSVKELYPCNKCPFVSKYKGSLREHNLAKHVDEEEVRWFKCNLCSFKTKRHRNLSKHKCKNLVLGI